MPRLKKKLSQVFIIWHIHIVGQDPRTYPIVWWKLWESMNEPKWSKQLHEYILTCNNKVLNMETPSEKHTKLLGTCPKLGGGYNHEDHLDEQAAPAS